MLTCIMLDEEFLSSAATEQNRMVLLVKLALTMPKTSSIRKWSPFQVFSTTGQPPSKAITRRRGTSPTASILPTFKIVRKLFTAEILIKCLSHLSIAETDNTVDDCYINQNNLRIFLENKHISNIIAYIFVFAHFDIVIGT